MIWRECLAVAAGGAAGALLRYGVGVACQRWLPESFPWGTWVVNLAGCFALGLLVEYDLLTHRLSAEWRLGLGAGLLGALTTFSTFGHETFRLWERGHPYLAVANIAMNLLLGLAAVVLGVAAARATWLRP